MTGDPKKGKMPPWKRMGNRTLTCIENYALGTNLSEFRFGYKIYNVHALKDTPLDSISSDHHYRL